MGSSAKKKREKKKDFQKPKLKVGKARQKAANQTDTSFRSKAIILNQQSLHESAPSAPAQFLHHLSLLASRSDSQRRDSLANLTSVVNSWSDDVALPQPLSTLLQKVFPLLLDGSNAVRQQAQRFLQALRGKGVADHVAEALPYIRAGMTHLSADIRLFSVETLASFLELAPHEVVSCAGGWTKTLNCFLALLGWHKQDSTATKWSSNRFTLGKAGTDGKSQARHLQVLADFLHTGLSDSADPCQPDEELRSAFPLWHAENHMLPTRSNPYGYLNLFATHQTNGGNGNNIDGDTVPLEDAEERARVFQDRGFATAVEDGLVSARGEGGETGRAAGLVTRALKSRRLVEMEST